MCGGGGVCVCVCECERGEQAREISFVCVGEREVGIILHHLSDVMVGKALRDRV